MPLREIVADEGTAARRRVFARAFLLADGSPVAGETGTPQISIDGATLTGTGIGALVEPGGSGNGGGLYYADLDAGTVAAANLGKRIETNLTTGTAAFIWDPAEVVANDTTVKTAALPTGARTITISVQDQNLDPVLGFRADIWNEAETELLWQVPDTDLDGSITIAVDDATYKVFIVRTQFTSDTIPETLVVTANASVTYDGTTFTVPASSDPTQCTVFGTLRKTEAGAIWAGERISFYATADGVVDANVQGNCIGEVITDAIGEFEIDLPRLASVLCVTTALGPINTTFSVTAVIPDLAGATFDSVFRP